jgi:hypothetical protein
MRSSVLNMAYAGQFDRRSTASFRSCAERIVLRSSVVWRSRHSQVMPTSLSPASGAPLRGSQSLDSVQLERLNAKSSIPTRRAGAN